MANSNDDKSFEVVLEYLNAFNDSNYGLEILIMDIN